MRLSLKKAAHVDIFGAAQQEIRVLRVLCEGWDPRISIPTFAYPTLCKERKGWGTRRFMALPALPNMNRELVSSQKAAHDALDGAAYRKFGYLARFSRDVGGDRWSPLLNLERYQSECSGIPHLAKKTEIWGPPGFLAGQS